MQWIRLNLLGIFVFLLFDLTGFVIDIMHGTGGSAKISTVFLCIGLVLSSIFFVIGTYKIIISSFPHLIKIVSLLVVFLLTGLQLLLSYIISFILAMYVISPIMGRMGYYVTMP
ncbi:MAG: hypothetical protein Q8O30_08980 [Candidatus Omnitrophota bacterium]|nr:hypothetical protein [Candidatus Omnitrophota bacterium]